MRPQHPRPDGENVVWLPIESVSHSRKLRTKICRSKLDRYRALMEAGREFPPISVLGVEGKYHIRDGRHRFLATLEAGHSFVKTTVIN